MSAGPYAQEDAQCAAAGMRAERDHEAGAAAAMGSELSRARAAEEAASAAAHEAVVSECRVKEYAVEAGSYISTKHRFSLQFVPEATCYLEDTHVPAGKVHVQGCLSPRNHLVCPTYTSKILESQLRTVTM